MLSVFIAIVCGGFAFGVGCIGAGLVALAAAGLLANACARWYVRKCTRQLSTVAIESLTESITGARGRNDRPTTEACNWIDCFAKIASTLVTSTLLRGSTTSRRPSNNGASEPLYGMPSLANIMCSIMRDQTTCQPLPRSETPAPRCATPIVPAGGDWAFLRRIIDFVAPIAVLDLETTNTLIHIASTHSQQSPQVALYLAHDDASEAASGILPRAYTEAQLNTKYPTLFVHGGPLSTNSKAIDIWSVLLGECVRSPGHPGVVAHRLKLTTVQLAAEFGPVQDPLVERMRKVVVASESAAQKATEADADIFIH